MSILHLLVYASALLFVIMIVVRGMRIARTPVHLRWELYPVPHEKGRADHGGSRLEQIDWWTHPIEKDHLGELKVMVPEILFLKAVKEHNPKLWFATFALHFGLYMLIGVMAVAMLGGLLQGLGVITVAAGNESAIGIIAKVFQYIFQLGCILGAVGAILMLYKRIFDSGMRLYATPSHFFNLFLMGAISISGTFWVGSDPNFATNFAGIYSALFTVSPMPELSAQALNHIGIVLLFVVYLPFTHMTHFFTKYFTYHQVRWEDSNVVGKMGDQLAAQLDQKVSWGAPHINGGGKKNWVDIATSSGKEEKN
ncbi:hypothetical protein K8I28_08495 [bacterium]|nr:hypothetical protein [bacterium]